MNSEDIARIAMSGAPRDSSVDDLTAIVIVLGVLLVCVALPLVLRHRARTRAMQGMSPADQAGVQQLWDTARRMETRIGYLETVLDTEVPGWRSRSEMR